MRSRPLPPVAGRCAIKRRAAPLTYNVGELELKSMSKLPIAEFQKLGINPSDAVWLWFTQTGPHGSSFTWKQTHKSPLGYVGVEHLERIINEKVENAPTFFTKLQPIVITSLVSTDVNIIRRGIQVATLVEGQEDLTQISKLTTHQDELVASDARASLFYLKKRLRSPL